MCASRKDQLERKVIDMTLGSSSMLLQTARGGTALVDASISGILPASSSLSESDLFSRVANHPELFAAEKKENPHIALAPMRIFHIFPRKFRFLSTDNKQSFDFRTLPKQVLFFQVSVGSQQSTLF